MKFRFLPTLAFGSMALNLFLVGVIAASWRDLRVVSTPPGPPPQTQPSSPGVEEADDSLSPQTPESPTQAPPPANRPDASRSGALRSVARAPDAPPSVPRADQGPAGDPAPVDGLAGDRQPRDDAPRPGQLQGPGGNPFMRAAGALPLPERAAFLELLRTQGEAVRLELRQSRRERAAAWRDLARGDVDQAEAAQRLDLARRRELAARGRVETAVADWAARQSPEVRARLGRALADQAAPVRPRPLRPPGWPGAPPSAGPGPEEES